MTIDRVIGLMSGTSLDGVDVALIETDGEELHGFGPTGYRPYNPAERALLQDALRDAVRLEDRHARPGCLADAEDCVTRAHAETVEAFLMQNNIAPSTVTAIGFHGQTVLHRPERGLTVQLGQGAALAQRLGMDVVYDFRAADVSAGGQGAPLVPVYHRALTRKLAGAHPIAILNIGGVANVTIIDGDAPPIACDTGPGNALLDDFMLERAGLRHDENGANAARGRVEASIVQQVLTHPFFSKAPPKSLDRNDFREWVASNHRLATVTLEDGAATLTAITAASIAAIAPHLPAPPRTWIVAGGGANNPTMLRMLKERLAPAAVLTAQEVGWSGDALEAQAFAFLAARSLRGLPITFPTTTGVDVPLTGGITVRPSGPSERA